MLCKQKKTLWKKIASFQSIMRYTKSSKTWDKNYNKMIHAKMAIKVKEAYLW